MAFGPAELPHPTGDRGNTVLSGIWIVWLGQWTWVLPRVVQLVGFSHGLRGCAGRCATAQAIAATADRVLEHARPSVPLVQLGVSVVQSSRSP